MSLWQKLSALDRAAYDAYTKIRDYRPDQLDDPRILTAVGARSVFALRPPATEYYHDPQVAEPEGQWLAIVPEASPPTPLLWTKLAAPFRELVAEVLDRSSPAYYALLLDLRAVIGRAAADTPSFSFAAFDANPDDGSRIIDRYLAGMSTTRLLYKLELEDRRPILIDWRCEEAETVELAPFWTDKQVHRLSFVSDRQISELHWASPLEAASPVRAILEEMAKTKSGAGHPADDLDARILELYKPTISGYRDHIENDRRAIQRAGPCTRLIGIFLPVSATPESQAATFFLFDCTEGLPSDQDQTFRVMLLARSLGGFLDSWQSLMRAEEAKLAEGLMEGYQNAFNAFAHQIRETAAGAGSGWLMRPAAWQEVVDTYAGSTDFAHRLETYRIAPAPELFEGLRTTLSFWAQSRKWQDLFLKEKQLPETLQELIEIAFEYAKYIRFVADFRNAEFQDWTVQLPKVWGRRGLDFLKKETHLRIVAPAGGVKPADVRLKKPPNEAAVDRRALFFSHLCDSLRLLVAVFDNYMGGRGDIKHPIAIAVSFARKQFITLKCSNRRQHDVGASVSNLQPGVRGRDVIRELTEKRLAGEMTWPLDDADPFELALDLPLAPLWDGPAH